jgi:DNA-binding response OmpR family regulator
MIERAISFQYENQEQAGNTEMNGSNSAKRILVVEDDNDLRKMIGEALEYTGHAVILAANREEALLTLAKEMPDLILLDVMLPDGSGLDICRRAAGREDADNHVTVFIMSGKTSMESKLTSYLCGAKRFFAKPFEMNELMEAISCSVSPKRNSRIERNSDISAVA